MLTWIAEEKTCPPKHSAIAKMYLIRVRVVGGVRARPRARPRVRVRPARRSVRRVAARRRSIGGTGSRGFVRSRALVGS